MTDRFSALTVTLTHDIREDDAQQLIQAIFQMRGVLDVRGHVRDLDLHIAHERAVHELADKLWAVLYPKQEQS